MKYTIEIVGMDDHSVRAKVTDPETGLQVGFTCGLGEPAGQLLQHIVRNAFEQIGREKIRQMMKEFGAAVHQ